MDCAVDGTPEAIGTTMPPGGGCPTFNLQGYVDVAVGPDGYRCETFTLANGTEGERLQFITGSLEPGTDSMTKMAVLAGPQLATTAFSGDGSYFPAALRGRE